MEPDLVELLTDYVRGRFFGKYRGVVVRNTDDTNRGRLLVRVPAIGNQEVWALPCLPFAGPGLGAYLLPEEGSGVWVEFEAGDLSYPIWTGCFWADDELPKDEQGSAATPPVKIMRSKEGMLVALDDARRAVVVSDGDGSNSITIEVQRGQVTVKGAAKVVVEAPQIELVDGAIHPLVFGDSLLQYLSQLVQIFNAHLHPGELALGAFPVTPAPPVPPISPPTPDLLSTRVKTG